MRSIVRARRREFWGWGCQSDVVPFWLIEKNYQYHSREHWEWLLISSDCNKIEPPIFYEIGSQNIKSRCIMLLSTLDAGLTCWTAQQLNHVRHWQGRVLHWLTTYFELMYFYVLICIIICLFFYQVVYQFVCFSPNLYVQQWGASWQLRHIKIFWY